MTTEALARPREAPIIPAHRALIPAAALYWGRLPAETRRLPAQALRYRFERLLPVPVEALHTASTVLSNGDVLMVAIEPERLRAHLAWRSDIGPTTWMLVPDDAPGHLVASNPSRAQLDQLNLLTGAFEPAPRRRLRLISVSLLHVGLAVALACAVVGIERRAGALDQHAASLQRSARDLLVHALPPQPGQTRPELRLTMELRTLEQAARSPAAASTDITAVLERLWEVWPATVRLQAETITATAERIVVRGTVPTLADAERLASACATVSGQGFHYRAEPLQAQSSERGATLLLTLVRQAGAAP